MITVVLGGLSACGFFQPKATWVEDSFEDFVDGTFDASGQNLYATRKGYINRDFPFKIDKNSVSLC